MLLPAEERGEAGVLLDTVISSLDSAWDMSVLRSPAGQFRIPGRLGDIGAPVRLRIRARDVIIATEPPRNLSALNVLMGEVSAIGGARRPAGRRPHRLLGQTPSSPGSRASRLRASA